ncbi:hypothetical protein CEXT_193451 [Caerostris extrusa]|uniref:Uncharacterized protein n=1 Tax=Caerostris extrusa TaxID=172846 RepID=A0AAV4PPW8_CAEEX|nr:hypothetical protein CEXT_193451 [Caerostris extrusa]
MQTSTSMINGAQVMRRCCSLRILHRSFSGQERSHAVLTKADPGVEWEELGREKELCWDFFSSHSNRLRHIFAIDFAVSIKWAFFRQGRMLLLNAFALP